MDIESIAKVCHEANRAYCETLGDYSQLAWEFAPDWQQQSAKMGVKFVSENPNAPAWSNHVSWAEEKVEQGWKYGPVKDADKKEHPCLVPFDQLPITQQLKDVLFKSIAMALLGSS